MNVDGTREMCALYLSSYGGTERPNEILNGQESVNFNASLDFGKQNDVAPDQARMRHCNRRRAIISSNLLLSINLGFIVYNEL